MERYDLSSPSIPLTLIKAVNGAPVSGMSVTVTVTNAKTGASLLASTACPEVASGSGIYTYNWTHGLIQDTEALVLYNFVTGKDFELIYLTTTSTGRAV